MSKPRILSLFRFDSKENQEKEYCCYLEPGSYDFDIMPESLEDLDEAFSAANVILATPISPFMDRARLESAPDLKLIQFMSVGYEKIDLDAATDLGIPVANNVGFNAVGVAEHAIMMVLVLLKKAFIAHHGVINGGWPQREIIRPGNYLYELNGKTLGVVGLGNIGTEVAKRADAFGARVIYNKRNRLSEAEEAAMRVEYGTLDELLRTSDVVSINTPLTDETRGMIGKEQIEMMKDTAILVNTARGPIVDEEALADALRQGKLWGAGIDVPRAVDDQEAFRELFRGIDNVVLTPHIASGTFNALGQCVEQFAQNIARFMRREKPLYLLNDCWDK